MRRMSHLAAEGTEPHTSAGSKERWGTHEHSVVSNEHDRKKGAPPMKAIPMNHLRSQLDRPAQMMQPLRWRHASPRLADGRHGSPVPESWSGPHWSGTDRSVRSRRSPVAAIARTMFLTLFVNVSSLLAVRLREERTDRRRHPDRGDVPGWVMVTLMTAALVALLLAVAGPALEGLFRQAIDTVTRK